MRLFPIPLPTYTTIFEAAQFISLTEFVLAGAQFTGAIFTIIINYGINAKQTHAKIPSQPITNGLIFQAVMVWCVVPLALMTGYGPFKRPEGSGAFDR